jgi:hypothetical protein
LPPSGERSKAVMVMVIVTCPRSHGQTALSHLYAQQPFRS